VDKDSDRLATITVLVYFGVAGNADSLSTVIRQSVLTLSGITTTAIADKSIHRGVCINVDVSGVRRFMMAATTLGLVECEAIDRLRLETALNVHSHLSPKSSCKWVLYTAIVNVDHGPHSPLRSTPYFSSCQQLSYTHRPENHIRSSRLSLVYIKFLKYVVCAYHRTPVSRLPRQ
jgi:hypothetical protein